MSYVGVVFRMSYAKSHEGPDQHYLYCVTRIQDLFIVQFIILYSRLHVHATEDI